MKSEKGDAMFQHPMLDDAERILINLYTCARHVLSLEDNVKIQACNAPLLRSL